MSTEEMISMEYYVYILSNNTSTIVYTGVTKDLIRRVYEHKHDLDPNGFSAKYQVHKLVYFESTSDINAAIAREKHPEASLTELAAMMEPPITKPAMNHRLKKLTELALSQTIFICTVQ